MRRTLTVAGALAAAALILGSVHLLQHRSSMKQRFVRWAAPLATWAPTHTKAIAKLPPALAESSGLARAANGGIWSVNDSGNRPALYLLTPAGALAATYTIPGLETEDLEALSQGPCPQDYAAYKACVYLFDTGDNLGMRPVLTIYSLPDPSTTTNVLPAAATHAAFADGPRDIEAGIVAADGTIWIASKGRHGPAVLSSLPFRSGTDVHTPNDIGVLMQEARRDHGTWFTGAGLGAQGSLYLRTYTAVFRYRPLSGRPGWDLRNPDYCFLGAEEPQGEALLPRPDGSLLTSSETNYRGHGWLRAVTCAWKPVPAQAWE